MIKELALDQVFSPVFAKSKNPVRLLKKDTSAGAWRLWLAGGLVAANAVLLLAYVYGVNAYASQGYEISTLQQNVTSLSSQNRQLNLQISQDASMVSIQNDFLGAGYVMSETPQFLQEGPSQLSLR